MQRWKRSLTAETIKRPEQDGIELPTAGSVKHRLELDTITAHT
jgi:hypothetical protein